MSNNSPITEETIAALHAEGQATLAACSLFYIGAVILVATLDAAVARIRAASGLRRATARD